MAALLFPHALQVGGHPRPPTPIPEEEPPVAYRAFLFLLASSLACASLAEEAPRTPELSAERMARDYARVYERVAHRNQAGETPALLG